MARDQLLALIADVNRLLSAGAAAASSSESLRKHGALLHQLSQQATVLKPIADAVDRVLLAQPKQDSRFLDLLLLTRQLRASLVIPCLKGATTPVPDTGAWRTFASVGDLSSLSETLAKKTTGREEILLEGFERLCGDLRLVPALLRAVADKSAKLADHVAEKVLPTLGPGILPDLLAQLDPAGTIADARRLRALCLIDPSAGAVVCRQALQVGKALMRIKALECLAEVGSAAEVEQTAVALFRDKAREVRLAAVTVLGRGRSDEGLECLLEAIADADDISKRAQQSLTTFCHPQTTTRVLRRLEAELSSLDQLGGEAQRPHRRRRVEQIGRLLAVLGDCRDEQRREAVPLLLRLAQDKETPIRHAALLALGGIRAEPGVLQALRAGLLKDDKEGGQAIALGALRRLLPAQSAALLPDVLKLVRSPDVSGAAWREGLFFLAEHVNQAQGTILQILRCALQSNEPSNGQWAASTATQALGLCGPAARETLPDLVEVFQKRLPGYGDNATCFHKIDPEGEEAIRLLLRMLRMPEFGARFHALRGLTPYGPRAAVAIPDIQRLIEEWPPHLQPYAKDTLSALEGR